MKYNIECQNPCGKPFLTVYVADDSQIEAAQAVLQNIDCTKNVNINSDSHLKRHLTVQINPSFSAEECAKLCALQLDKI